jgi:gliding motility-associated-like protein
MMIFRKPNRLSGTSTSMIARLLLILLILQLPGILSAQYLSVNQRFIVDEKKGCSSLQVTITNTNLKPGEALCGPGLPCDITWGDGTLPDQINVSTATHTYTQPGTYTLRVLYQSAGFDEIQIIVTPNTLPDFNLFTCSGNEVQIRVTDTNFDGYSINFGDGSPEVLVPKGVLAVSNHTFGTSGNKSISVRGKNVNAADNCSAQSQNFLALPSLPTPFINELDVISNTQIDILLTTLPNIQYRLEVATNNNTNFQLAQNIYNQTTASLTNLRTEDNYYCFRLGAFDPCNNTTSYSNRICSTNFDVTAQNNQNNLSWTTNTAAVLSFSIIRDGVLIANTNLTSFIDNQVTCNTTYCYQLVTNYNNGSSSVSLPQCVVATSTDIPAPVTNATAVVTPNGLTITWQENPVFPAAEYRILRKAGDGPFQPFATSTTPLITDPDYTTEKNFSYQLEYTDLCGNKSPVSNPIIPIRLEGSVNSENHIQLAWNSYSGWQNGVQEYIIEKYSAQGQLLQTISVGPGITNFTDTDFLPDQQVIRYVIKANASVSGLGQVISNEIIITKNPNIFYPSAFTPDNQGPIENEVFRVYGQYIGTFEIQIFNRWGELLYSSKNIDEGWDGTFNGKELPEGTYAFIARLIDLTGTSFTRSGSVVLLRKK